MLVDGQPVLTDADSVTFLVHGVGEHSGHEISAEARKGLQASDITTEFEVESYKKAILSRTRNPKCPWTEEGSFSLLSDGSKHVVLPCTVRLQTNGTDLISD